MTLFGRRLAGACHQGDADGDLTPEPGGCRAGWLHVLPTRTFLPLAVVAALTGCTQAESTSIDRFTQSGELVALSGAGAGAANACHTCHGLEGQGNGAGASRLAGLERGYIESQLIAYGDGRRHHPQMRWIAKHLEPDERQAVAAYYSAMPFETSAGALPSVRLYHEGDPKRGLAACATCHGDRGQGVGAANPALAGQPPAYLAEQLHLWRIGQRRSDALDMMVRISQLLTPAESRALSAYASSLSGGPPSPEPPGASREARRADPRNGASGPPLHVPESARATE